MGLLIFAYRKQDIIRRKSDLELTLMKLKQKLSDLHSYSSSIADGSVSLNDLMKAPPSVFNRMSMFMMYSHQGAMSGAQEKFNFITATQGAVPQMPNAQLQQQYAQMLFNNLYKQEKEKFLEREKYTLNEQDKKISQQSETIQAQLKMLEAELASTKEGEDKYAKDSAPKYV